MADYIDRKTAMREIDYSRTLTSAYLRVATIPAADVMEVKHGRWIGGYYNHNGAWLYTKPCCSICSFEQEGVSNYCPNCGAKMDGEING